MMRQLQFYKYATWGLLLLNLSMIAFFFLTRPQPDSLPLRENGKDRAIDILKLDEPQHDVFLEYVQKHIQLMEGFDNQQRKLLKTYFTNPGDSTADVDSQKLLDQFTQLEREKIESTYQHLEDVKSILKPVQQENFGDFKDHALEIILLTKKDSPPPKRK